jgi:hypothetical protein
VPDIIAIALRYARQIYEVYAFVHCVWGPRDGPKPPSFVWMMKTIHLEHI